jgi:ribosomal protein L7/L12
MSKYQVIVGSLPTDRTKFVEALRRTTPLTLKQALDVANHLERFRNSTLVAGVDLEVADHIASALRETGAEVVLAESSVTTPMLCNPEGNTNYRWGMLRVIKKAI